ncbi:DUF6624 domain-containing protein [Sphingobacterium sp. HMA12]|uniref:DUF6624 domain-containing protein n=1 Tax=Sphingobacterium sp. HMA12 TaxID=2050894 RepID=UPI000CEA32C0|nr:DUF6624 domain-containing protein [Sphingobacterium sp. HMA12]
MVDEKLAKELIQLANADRLLREDLAQKSALGKGYHPKMEAVHRANAKRLCEIIDKIGYPGISKVGEEASEAAWLIVQHAVSEPLFMQNCYQLMTMEKKDINLAHIAYLYDRIQCFKGKPQRFGTQLTADGGIYPVENKEDLNKLRLGMNLPQLTKRKLETVYHVDELKILDQRDPDYTIWRKKVGWI